MSIEFRSDPSPNYQTNDATPVVVGEFALPDPGRGLLRLDAKVTARTPDGDAAAWNVFAVAIKQVAAMPIARGNVVLVGRSIGASLWDVAVVASANGIQLVVTGDLSKRVDWYFDGTLFQHITPE